MAQSMFRHSYIHWLCNSALHHTGRALSLMLFRFGATIDDRLVSSSIKCLPENCRVASMNVTAILALRGNSFVEEEDYLNAVDNNLRPYHLQMHAGIYLYYIAFI